MNKNPFRKDLPLPRPLQELSAVFSAAGFSSWLVGGAVRDRLLGGTADDWDVASDARPEETLKLFPRCIPTGLQHGTITVLFKGHPIEVTTLRTESDYSDGRHPDKVSWTANIEEDRSRRDFTINAMVIDLKDGRLIDPFGGRVDIKNRLIRCVGNPAERFGEDALRLLRAVRFSSRLDFAIEPETYAALSPLAPRLALVSIERVQSEFSKMLQSEVPSRALRTLVDTSLLEVFLPELAACTGVEQKGRHAFDVFTHLALAADACPKERLDLRLAALFHDIGKPPVRALDERGDWTFHRHEEIGARMAKDILTRMRYPNSVIEKVTHLVAEHMFNYGDDWTDAAVRRFIRRVGREHIDDLFALRRADMYATRKERPADTALLPFLLRIEAEDARGSALTLKDLAINGRDLASAGIAAGPWMGRILNELLECVTDSPDMNNRESLLELARRLDERRMQSQA